MNPRKETRDVLGQTREVFVYEDKYTIDAKGIRDLVAESAATHYESVLRVQTSEGVHTHVSVPLASFIAEMMFAFDSECSDCEVDVDYVAAVITRDTPDPSLVGQITYTGDVAGAASLLDYLAGEDRIRSHSNHVKAKRASRALGKPVCMTFDGLVVNSAVDEPC